MGRHAGLGLATSIALVAAALVAAAGPDASSARAAEAAVLIVLNPRGLAVDSTSRTLLAEAAANHVAVFDRSGARVAVFGSTGSGNGQFQEPWDVAVDPRDRLYVSDRGNHRIQLLDRNGNFVRRFGGPGSSPGRLNLPQGIAFDAATSKLYVADTGNERVQRFRADGTLDRSWGGDGVVGSTGVVRRDHTGFDGPTDVAVNPTNGRVYVADHGNQRLEVFDPDGRYLRTFLAVYRPNGLAFDRRGNLYIAGEDPNANYHAFDGRLRFLAAGDRLISRHYTGGLDDLGEVLGGVALRPDGRIVLTDPGNRRIVMTDPSFTVPVSGLSVQAHGTRVTFRWRTAVPAPSKVLIGGRMVSGPGPVTDHTVTAAGLTPNTRLTYGVSFLDSFNGALRFTDGDPLNTGAVAGRTPFLRIKAAGVIYTDVQPGPGYTRMDAATLADTRARFLRMAAFYWRNSRFRLWPDITLVEVDRDVTEPSLNLFASMEPDLAALGFGAADALDAAWGTSELASGNFGGVVTNLFGRTAVMSEWVTPTDFVAIHEVNHSIDALYGFSGLGKYEFNHGLWAIPNGLGHEVAINGQILRNFLPANFTATTAPFDKVVTARDADNDGVPDTSPQGLTVPLPVTEATLGSSTASADTDRDGLGDLAEATALPFHNTNLNAADSDGDGVRDGADPNPAYRMNERIAKATPTIDGVIGPAEPWTVLTQHWGYSNDALLPDSNQLQDQVTTYAAWDDRNLYLALEGPAAVTAVHVDGRADNRFISPDNYELRVGGGAPLLEVQVNVGVPDLFRQIDDDGQFSEFFDTNPQFAKPYQGRPILGHPDEGLGFPARLVTEADLSYAQQASGATAVWEVAIPWSNATSFHGFEGKRLAIGLDVADDRLFETDHTPLVTLIAGR
jgi:DNA-binding beta-propeller fold protein YncE